MGGGNKKILLKKPNNNTKNTYELVNEAIRQLNERHGSSMEAIKKYIMNKKPEADEKRLRIHIKKYINSCLADGTMEQIKRSFKLTKKFEANLKQKEKEKLKAKQQKEKEKEKQAKQKVR